MQVLLQLRAQGSEGGARKGSRSEVAELELPHKPALPGLFISNARSLFNKMDELRLQVVTDCTIRDSCVLTQNPDFIPNSAIKLTDLTTWC